MNGRAKMKSFFNKLLDIDVPLLFFVAANVIWIGVVLNILMGWAFHATYPVVFGLNLRWFQIVFGPELLALGGIMGLGYAIQRRAFSRVDEAE